jgi:hypothetical protein
MADLIDGRLDELDTHLRQLRREVSRLEPLRRQLRNTGRRLAGE